MALIIRPIRPSDRDVWLRMRADLWPGDDHASEIETFFAGRAVEPQAVLLALQQGKAAGVCELAVRTNVPGAEGLRTAFVEGLYVDPAYRNGLVARSLLKAAQGWARSKGCEAFGSDRDERFILDPKFNDEGNSLRPVPARS